MKRKETFTKEHERDARASGDFKEQALKSFGAIDVLTNSDIVEKKELQPGDTLYDSQASHIQVVTKVTEKEINIHQGNLGLGWSDNPESIGYRGVDVQTGTYNRSTGDYKRNNSSNPSIKGYLNELFLLRWNFKTFKK